MTRNNFYLIEGWNGKVWVELANRLGNAPYHEVKQKFDGLKAMNQHPGYTKFRMINREIRDTVHEVSE